jgi:hypothetical protein
MRLFGAHGIRVDWDGCVVVGIHALPATLRLFLCHADRVLIISNGLTYLPEQFSAFLARAGLAVPAPRITLAVAEAAAWVAEAGDAGRVLVFSSVAIESLPVSPLERQDPGALVPAA